MDKLNVLTVWTNGPSEKPLGKQALSEENEGQYLGLRLERAVFSQIARYFGKREMTINVDKDGILRIPKPDNYSEKEWLEAEKLLHYYRCGIFARHQFEDCIFDEFLSKKEYQDWFDTEKESYLMTMPMKHVLQLSDYDRNGKKTNELSNTFYLHSGSDELTRPNYGIEGYSISNFKGILEKQFNPYMLLSLIGKDVHVEMIQDKPYIVCTKEIGKRKTKIAASPYTKEVFYVTDKGLRLIGNSYEYLFKTTALPVQMVINSVLTVTNPYMLPGEGIGEYKIDRKLSQKVEKAIKDPKAKEAKQYIKTSRYFD